jgi:hypothetical protein
MATYIVLVFSFVFLIPGVMVGMLGYQKKSSSSMLTGGVLFGFAALLGFLFPLLLGSIGAPAIFAIVTYITFSLVHSESGMKSKLKEVVQTVRPDAPIRAYHYEEVEAAIENLKAQDPNFSSTVFLDFASSLFHQYHIHMGKSSFQQLTPFFAPDEIQHALAAPGQLRVSEIVIGSIYIKEVFESAGVQGIVVDVEANYTTTFPNESKTRYIVIERWLFNRPQGQVSLAPEKMREVSCPSCGAPANFTDAGTCTYCHTTISSGEMNWFVKKTKVLSKEEFEVYDLTHYEPEVGTDFPTIFQPNLQQKAQQFLALQGLNDWQAFAKDFENQVVSPTFKEIYQAWTDMKWERVRHLTSDRLFESNGFWLEGYKEQNLRPNLKNLQVSRVDIARIDLDKYYQAITVRIFANCLDFVTDNDGRIKGGDSRKPRYYSEYWTFLRGTSASKNPTEINLNQCPNCGAPADKMGATAICGYCDSKISTGDFGWVVAKITQDEVYEG